MTHDYEPPLGEFQPPDGPTQEEPEEQGTSTGDYINGLKLDEPCSRPALASGGTRCDRWARIIMGTASAEDVAEATRQGEYIIGDDGISRRTAREITHCANVSLELQTEQEKRDRLVKLQVEFRAAGRPMRSPTVEELVKQINEDAAPDFEFMADEFFNAVSKAYGIKREVLLGQAPQGTSEDRKRFREYMRQRLEAGTVRAVPQEQWEAMRTALGTALTEMEHAAAVFRTMEIGAPRDRSNDDFHAGACARRLERFLVDLKEVLS